jgi:hypothetical protein
MNRTANAHVLAVVGDCEPTQSAVLEHVAPPLGPISVAAMTVPEGRCNRVTSLDSWSSQRQVDPAPG